MYIRDIVYDVINENNFHDEVKGTTRRNTVFGTSSMVHSTSDQLTSAICSSRLERSTNSPWSESTPATCELDWITDGLKVSARPLFTPALLLLVPAAPRVSNRGKSDSFNSLSEGMLVVFRKVPCADPPPVTAPLPPLLLVLLDPGAPKVVPRLRPLLAPRGGEALPVRRAPRPTPPTGFTLRESAKLFECAFCSFKKSRLLLFKVGDVLPGLSALSMATC